MVDGQCLCGKVRFEVSGSLGDVRLCYCELCRRANGTVFSANVRVPIGPLTRWFVADAGLTPFVRKTSRPPPVPVWGFIFALAPFGPDTKIVFLNV
jgi:hypothetical protein